MRSILWAGALPALALASLGDSRGARAEDKPVTGIPDESIEQGSAIPCAPLSLQRGILYGVNWIGEYWNVAKGANSTGSNFDGRLEVYADIDLEKLIGWKGGVIHANAYYIHGVGASTERVGNIFAVSNIEGLETIPLFELWFEQSMLQDKLKVRVGSIASRQRILHQRYRRAIHQRYVRLARHHCCRHGGRWTGLSAAVSRRTRAILAER